MNCNVKAGRSVLDARGVHELRTISYNTGMGSNTNGIIKRNRSFETRRWVIRYLKKKNETGKVCD
jgi:hypothetical protein